ncbi:MAG TPA: type II toxin-antitoxin system Phd/YefM family antitoxin [Pirellulales bacterium]
MATGTSHVESLTNFQQRTAEILAELHRSGDPLVLTVDGKPELVVQDAAAYQRLVKLVEEVERRETIAALREGLADSDAGRVRPFSDAMREIAAKQGLTFPET